MNSRSAISISCSALGMLALASATLPQASADEARSQLAVAQHDHGGNQKRQADELVRTVRESTARFLNVNNAEAEGYHLMFGCVSGPDSGAMGMHFVNMELVGDGRLEPTQPEIVIYEPQPDGRLRLIGADYLLFAKDWGDPATKGAPELMGQLMHYFESPNRFGLPAFYTLHVWAWKDSPTGTFVNWNQKVSCNAFDGKQN